METDDLVTVKITSTYWRKYHHGVVYIVKKVYTTQDVNGNDVVTAKIISQYEIDNNFGSETIPVSELTKVE